jgi:cyclopropane-fatty-acyl-phospholipid synthase
VLVIKTSLEMASYLPIAITQPLARGSDLIRGALGGVSWGPVLSVSKAAVTSLLTRIELGQLVIRDETTGQTTSYGQKIAKEHTRKTNGVNGVNGAHKKIGGVRKVELVVKREAFWVRLFLFADMGFAESYMLGDFECADLTSFFEVNIPCRSPGERL